MRWVQRWFTVIRSVPGVWRVVGDSKSSTKRPFHRGAWRVCRSLLDGLSQSPRLVLAGNPMASNTSSLAWQLVVNIALGLGGELFLVNNFGDEAPVSPAYVLHRQLPNGRAWRIRCGWLPSHHWPAGSNGHLPGGSTSIRAHANLCMLNTPK